MATNAQGQPMSRVMVRGYAQIAVIAAVFVAVTVTGLRFFAPTFGVPANFPLLGTLYRVTGPLVTAVAPLAASASKNLQIPLTAPEVAFFVTCFAGMPILAFANEVLPRRAVLIPQSVLNERWEARQQLNTAFLWMFGLAIAGLALYWLSQHPFIITGAEPSGQPGTAGAGTLTVSADDGYIYVDGTEYGQGGISVTLASGSYVVTAVAPSTGATCWQTNIHVGNGTQSLIKNDTWCR